jgi:hypothetical protein
LNQPFGSCHNHFEEVANLVDDLQKYQTRRHGHPSDKENDNFTQPINSEPNLDVDHNDFEESNGNVDVDVDEMDHNDFEESNGNVDDGLFIEEYEGVAKEYGAGTTLMKEFDSDQYTKERVANLYYPFASRDEWELASFLLRSGLSKTSITSFLSLTLVRVSLTMLIIQLILDIG